MWQLEYFYWYGCRLPIDVIKIDMLERMALDKYTIHAVHMGKLDVPGDLSVEFCSSSQHWHLLHRVSLRVMSFDPEYFRCGV